MGEQRLRSRTRAGTGQHFLVPRLAADLVRNSGVTRGDLVVEIGAGTGALTCELASRAGRVIAVEIDPVLIARLRKRFARDRPVRIVGCDARDFRFPVEPFRVVANVPFAHTTDLLLKALRRSGHAAAARGPDRAVGDGREALLAATEHAADDVVGAVVGADDHTQAVAVELPSATVVRLCGDDGDAAARSVAGSE